MKQISEWAYQWKTLFNTDLIKQAAEAGFSHKRDNVPHEPLTFNNNKTQSELIQKYLELILDSKLDLNQHRDDKINTSDKIIRTMRRFSKALSSLLILCKPFVRPLLDYADM